MFTKSSANAACRRFEASPQGGSRGPQILHLPCSTELNCLTTSRQSPSFVGTRTFNPNRRPAWGCSPLTWRSYIRPDLVYRYSMNQFGVPDLPAIFQIQLLYA